MNTGDTRIDLESLLIPNPAHTILVHYKEKDRVMWLLVDQSKEPAPGQLTLVPASSQKYSLEKHLHGMPSHGVVTYMIVECKLEANNT